MTVHAHIGTWRTPEALTRPGILSIRPISIVHDPGPVYVLVRTHPGHQEPRFPYPLIFHPCIRNPTRKNRISKSLNKIAKNGIVRNFGFLPHHVVFPRDIVSLSS